jgi:hypothetical protein
MTSVSKFVQTLGGRLYGGGLKAICRCPAHDDRDPSLSVTDIGDKILVHCHAGCDQNAVIGELEAMGLWNYGGYHESRSATLVRLKKGLQARQGLPGTNDLFAQRLWSETIDCIGTWGEEYLTRRDIALPLDRYLRKRTLRFHPQCPFPGCVTAPALICAFRPILTVVPSDPFHDSPVSAIHRIRGRGHDNKAMLGPVKGKAVQFGEWEEVSSGGVIHVTEGVETALARLARNHRPIWALGSAGALESMPVLAYACQLVVWADSDESGRGEQAADKLARRYAESGRKADVFLRGESGKDFGDA